MMRLLCRLCLLLFSSTTAAMAAQEDSQYVVTIDAGSSGSRVHVHQVTFPTQEQPIPSIVSAVNSKITPGLSSFEEAPEDADGHVKGLVEFALKHVPDKHWARTPLYLKATAGLRSIPAEKKDQILSIVRGSFSATPFVFEYDWARVITGTDEGLYGWMAANYLKGRFHPESTDPLVGVIEMGGASLQISFPLSEGTSAADEEDVSTITLGKTYKVYAHSFLNFGLDKAQDLPMDDKEACYPQGYSTPAVTGKGDYDKCYQAMDSILGKNHCPTTTPPQKDMRCSINGKMVPNFDQVKFLAIENFYYTTSFLQTETHLTSLPQKGQAFCSESWQTHQQTYNQEDADSLKRYCFGAAYIMAILDKGLDISPQKVEIAHTVDQTDLDWAIGSAIHDILQLHPPPPPTDTSAKKEWRPNRISKLLTPFGLILLAFFALAKWKQRRQKKYMPVPSGLRKSLSSGSWNGGYSI